MIVMIDNYDSFTYNLVQYLGQLGEEVDVYRNDQIGVREIEALAPDHIVISPGPGTPNEAGISIDVINYFCAKVPHLRRLSRSPGNGASLRRANRACARGHAWQDIADPAL